MSGEPDLAVPPRTVTALAALCSVGLLVAIPLHAQDRFTGTWNGELDAGAVQLRLVLHVEPGEEGYTAALDSPDQGAFGIEASAVATTGDSLTVEFADVAGQYAGALDAGGTSLSGTWTQGGQVFPLMLERGEPEQVRRPQNPEAPFPYREEEVRFAGGSEGVELAGTLTLPGGAGPHPAAILVSGSGPQDRNEEIFQHKPFLVLAEYLTRRGIAELRYDDRGVAGSTGDFAAATTRDFAADAEAALVYLRTRSDIDPAAIGLIGHSEGGVVAPLVASRVAIDWIVMIAGPGLPGDSILALQVDALNEAAGMPSAQRAAANSLQRRLMDIAVSDRDPVAAQDEVAGLLRAEVPGLAEGQALAQAAALTSPWMREFLRYDPRPVLRELRIPVLAVNGGNDLQVLPGPNLAAIESALAAAGNEDFATVELEGLNHLLQTSETGLVTEYGRIEETIAPIALQTIGDWIEARART
ncbi:MAG TPA: alpha/beta fold hydrolase [Gemmatimonadota bacterium]|nr:alpha/beta fold hydrolase [Gemmatimonadota bacterium]